MKWIPNVFYYLHKKDILRLNLKVLVNQNLSIRYIDQCNMVINDDIVLNRLVQFNVIRRYVKTNSIHTTHRLNALAAPPGIRV